MKIRTTTEIVLDIDKCPHCEGKHLGLHLEELTRPEKEEGVKHNSKYIGATHRVWCLKYKNPDDNEAGLILLTINAKLLS